VIPARVKAPATRSADPIQASPLALQPELLTAFLRLYGTLWSHGVVDQATKEIARIRNARTIDCPICKAIRFKGARDEGLGEEQVELVRDGYEASALTSRQKLVLRFVDRFLGNPGDVDPELRRELLAHFTPPQIVELTAALALFAGFSKIAVALGGLPDAIPVHEQPTPVCPAPAARETARG